jgi:hypothetical protein
MVTSRWVAFLADEKLIYARGAESLSWLDLSNLLLVSGAKTSLPQEATLGSTTPPSRAQPDELAVLARIRKAAASQDSGGTASKQPRP